MTINSGKHFARSLTLFTNIARVFQRRTQLAQNRYQEHWQAVLNARMADALQTPPWVWWTEAFRYSVDFTQRSVLFWDVLRQRGNQFIERQGAGLPPVLHFRYEPVLDAARNFDRPVNYALVRILPPAGASIDPKRRPFIVIDPRAGHGPGIGGFKDDSQVGEALREGHPVYFVIFFPDPEPDQTMLDVCAAEQAFVRKVRELHPDSPKPAIVGNCQGGWAAMMLAASNPNDTGPIVINGAPMSYWGGAWAEGEGDNPMRYAGGLLGGTWLASLFSDLGNGKFDGAYLVQNFENLNPANTFWKKNYNVFANVDTEAPRFLDFERWWGGYYLLNREEIEWITRNLFVGNKLWSGGVQNAAGETFDLRDIRSPIILFASLGDNITPPQQAFNWVADVYGSTEEIKARGQIIVGLVHADIGHLGIFVSGRIAKREHRQIVSVLKTIEALPPGLYAMRINEIRKGKKNNGPVEYEVEFEERKLEDVVKQLNRFERIDEGPFRVVAEISEFNQRAYELFARPVIKDMVNDFSARLGRDFHPLRFEKWWISNRNPALWWIEPCARFIRNKRQSAEADSLWRRLEANISDMIGANWDFYRDVRDASSEAQFYLIYGNLFALYVAERAEAARPAAGTLVNPRELPFVKTALDAIAEGGYPEALARAAELLEQRGMPLPLSRLELKTELIGEYAELLPDLPLHAWKRIRGEQDAIVSFEPERALATLPTLLRDPHDRANFLQLMERLLSDPRVRAAWATPAQGEMIARIHQSLGAPPPDNRRDAVAAPTLGQL